MANETPPPTAGELAAELRKIINEAPDEMDAVMMFYCYRDRILNALTPTQDGPSAEVVERVARALAAASDARWDAKHFGETPAGETPDEMRDGFRDLARAAIQAMPPTTSTVNKAMLEALEQALPELVAHYVSVDEDPGLRAKIEATRTAIALAKGDRS